ncbi:MAG TPA: serine/threonine-protein kinase [Streptosporangiaceae bacterium]|nr:serine/threonine-protein kinase [Streptosporangiaceae bacterium]
MPGDRVLLAGRYRLEDRIAVGGAGEVWRAADAVLGRAVAVKLLRPEYAGNGEMLARFRAEARYAALVCHPGVVPVYDYGQGGPVGAPFLVMELVDGPSLADVAACGPLEPAWVLDMAGQVAAGLAAAHAQGLVHRDIKPANLLLAPGGTVKITDFGIASAAGSASLTLTGTLPGTPGYLAPERAAGAPATAASDLYSLGVVAWECLAGAPPFTGTPLEIALAHADRVMPPLPAAIPGGVVDLVAELTAKDPAARPASAASVAARAGQLRAAITGTATVTMDRSAAGRPGPLPPTLAGVTVQRAPRLGRLRPRRLATLAVAMLLAAWLTAEMSGAASRTHPASPAPAASGVRGARMVIVDEAALAGQPAGPVLRQLRRAGLQPSLVWVPDGHLAAGTVISVRPAGQVLAGGTVTVTTAMAPPGHRRGRGNGEGDGNDG